MKNRTFSQRIINAPYFLWAAIFIIVPMLMVLYFAFTNEDTGEFTFENISMLTDYADTFLISIIYSVVATAVCLIIAYPLAYIMSKMHGRVKSMMYLLVMLPMWMNLLIRTYSWTTILEQNGIINRFLGLFGIGPVKMMGTPGAIVLGMVYDFLPYMILPIFTVLSKLDKSLLEAAEDLGSNAFIRFKRVILPLSLPGIISGITMVFVPSVSTFYISQVMSNRTIMLIGVVIDRQIQEGHHYNLGAALSLVLMVFILISMFIMNRFDKDNEIIV